MSDYNAIGNPLLASGVPRLYGVDKGLISVVGSEIQVTTSPWERPEFWALMGGSLGIGHMQKLAVAAQFSRVQLYNASSTGVLGILERLMVCNNAAGGAQRYKAGYYSVAFATSTGGWLNRDLRRAQTSAGSGALALRVRTESTATPTFDSQLMDFTVPVQSALTIDCEIIIPPGWGFVLQAETLNVDLQATCWGRERPAPETELSKL